MTRLCTQSWLTSMSTWPRWSRPRPAPAAQNLSTLASTICLFPVSDNHFNRFGFCLNFSLHALFNGDTACFQVFSRQPVQWYTQNPSRGRITATRYCLLLGIYIVLLSTIVHNTFDFDYMTFNRSLVVKFCLQGESGQINYHRA